MGVRIAYSINVHRGDLDIQGLADQRRQIREGPVRALGLHFEVSRADAININERFDVRDFCRHQFLDERLRTDQAGLFIGKTDEEHSMF